MKKYIISLDGGTTNTRLTLCTDEIIDRKKLALGARDGKDALAAAVRHGISELLSENSLNAADIEAVVASGMITSELGLYNVPHIKTPVRKNDLLRDAAKVSLPDISDIPFIFIHGVKTFDSADVSLCSMDIMRGEEVETVAIVEKMGLSSGNVTLILPGSHMKIVSVSDSKIVDFKTTVSGELTRAAAENTILKNSIGDYFTRDIDKDWLMRGYELCDTLGVGAALFKLRVAGNFMGVGKAQLYSCLLGIVLHDDVLMIAKSASGTVAVGGSNPFRAAYVMLLADKVADLREVPDELAENAAAYGAASILE